MITEIDARLILAIAEHLRNEREHIEAERSRGTRPYTADYAYGRSRELLRSTADRLEALAAEMNR